MSTSAIVDPVLLAMEQETRWLDAIDQLEEFGYLWYSYAVRMKLTPCRGWCKTAAVDGVNLFFNPEWSATLSDRKLLFVLIHEVFHIAAGHLWRGASYIQAEKDPKEQQKIARRVNRAQDGAIHQIWVPLAKGEYSDILEFPEEGIYDPEWDNMSFEQIYDLMLSEEENSPGDNLDIHVMVGSGMGEGNPDGMPEGATDLGDGNWILVTDGDGNPIKGDPSDKENPFPGVTKEDLQKIASEAVKEAREAEANGGTQAGTGMGAQLRIAEIGQSKMDWKQILRQWVLMAAKSDYRFTRPNRRYLAMGMLVPGLVSESITGVVAIDVSGSIDTKTYNSFMTELAQIRKELPDHNLHVIWCSDGIHKTQVVTQHEEINPKFSGTGGTNFKPSFDYVEKNVSNPLFMIYFTDGYNGDRHSVKKPDYPVLWALNGSSISEYPWGINLRIEK